MVQYAPNPLLNDHIFIPDVEAHVWADGRIYLYGSFDIQNRNSFCSDCYHVYSSDNLTDWIDHGVSFTIADTNWAKECGVLYAPDCAYRDGWYYLYYCVPDGRCGVAKSQSPTGPFEDVGQIEGVWGIDPAVLIDDDGQAYLYWGQITWGKAAKLKDNMVEIDPETVVQPLSVEDHEFHEGSSVKKIDGKYYYLFADTHRHGHRPSCLGYAISDHPLTGFKYGGVIIDNFGCDPYVWNNHGSMVCFKGQWYVFYHRSTHGTEFSRHVCAEPIFFNEDGSISEVVQTTSGVGEPLPASQYMRAHRACMLSGHARIAGDATLEDHLILSAIHSGDTATFRYLCFEGENSFSVNIKSNGRCRVEIYTDGCYHGEVEVLGSDDFTSTNQKIDSIVGTYSLTLKFYGEFTEASMDQFCFSHS